MISLPYSRCGQGLGCSDMNERSPIFLQWLDCVHQVLSCTLYWESLLTCPLKTKFCLSLFFFFNYPTLNNPSLFQLLLQFPCHFEFNLTFLVKLAEHTYR